ncbi:MAG: cupin domain-containing protein [Jatrophihabitans sp.]|uniref:cupin domain-containing protein n=1 Tax=Jatrophihabitans sp. TaxID=1932789 RepID=UPI003915D362
MLRNPEGSPRTPAVIELTVPPGGSPPRHVHHALEDSFLLLEGEMVVRCADETIVAKPGTYVVVPALWPTRYRTPARRAGSVAALARRARGARSGCSRRHRRGPLRRATRGHYRNHGRLPQLRQDHAPAVPPSVCAQGRADIGVRGSSEQRVR